MRYMGTIYYRESPHEKRHLAIDYKRQNETPAELAHRMIDSLEAWPDKSEAAIILEITALD